MGFLLPLGFLFALSIPVLILFYLLKVKRRPRRVSSTWLWRATVEDARASIPFQRLRRNLLMILQILILALLAFALARPILNLRLGNAGSVLILIDSSASMAMRAVPGGPTRFEEAQRKAKELVNALPDGVQALVLPYASRASVAAPMTLDRARLRRSIDELRVQATGQDLKSALVLAASLVGSEPSPQIVIFSDTADLGAAEAEIIGVTPVVVEAVGTSAANFGWTALSVQRDAATADAFSLFGQILHRGESQAEVGLRIEADGRLLEARTLLLQPGAETPVIVERLAIEGEPMLHARLSPAAGAHDALELDNDAWVRIRPSRKVRLLVCSPGNYFLTRVLSAIEEVEPVFVAPGQKLPDEPCDAAIFDRALPANPPAVPALFIGLSPWAGLAGAVVGDAALPVGAITHWDSDHPVAQNVQWSTVSVFAADAVVAPPGARPLVESGDVPLLLLGRAEGQVALHLAFDLFRSNFPLRAAFPIFIRNAVNFLTRDRTARETQSWTTGHPLSFAAPPGVDSVKLVSPSERVWELTPGPDRLVSFGETHEAGVWLAEIPGRPSEHFGVNLMDRTEGDPAVVEPVRIDSDGERQAGGLGGELRSNREVWRWLAAAALAILMLEWFLYRRPRAA